MQKIKTDIKAFQIGDEKRDHFIKDLSLNSRHPIFKALMKLEFEKAIREYLKEL